MSPVAWVVSAAAVVLTANHRRRAARDERRGAAGSVSSPSGTSQASPTALAPLAINSVRCNTRHYDDDDDATSLAPTVASLDNEASSAVLMMPSWLEWYLPCAALAGAAALCAARGCYDAALLVAFALTCVLASQVRWRSGIRASFNCILGPLAEGLGLAAAGLRIWLRLKVA